MTHNDDDCPACATCGRELDQPGVPEATNCGGDCLACVVATGDPDALERLLRLREVPLRQALERAADALYAWGHIRAWAEARQALSPREWTDALRAALPGAGKI